MPERGPASLRSPRSRAVDIGTDQAGFTESLPYNSKGGYPISADVPQRTYQEQAPAVLIGGTASINQPSPFKLGGT